MASTENRKAYDEVREYLSSFDRLEDRNLARAYIFGYVSADVPAHVLRRAVESHREDHP